MTSIEGLCIRPEEPATLVASLRTGRPDVAEAVGVTIEAYQNLGFTPNIDDATESLTTNFTQLTDFGYYGRLYVEPPKGVGFDQIIGVADDKRAKGVDKLYRYPNLWTPGTEDNSYTTEELDGSPSAKPEARLAIFNADETTGVDPLLHFLNTPFDDKYRDGAPQTQLEALEATSQEFAKANPNDPQAFVRALGHRAAVMLVLMDRIRGVKPRSADFVLNQGFLRIPELGRRAVDGGSVVGFVDSDGSRLKLGGSDGRADPDRGVGVSVGLKELEPQAS